jgi:hypothetical protein
MKAIRASFFALFIAVSAPASAAPIAVGEFAFNFDASLLPDFQYFSIANFLDSLVTFSATIVATRPIALFDDTLDGAISPGESAISEVGDYLGSLLTATLVFGEPGFYLDRPLSLPADISDPFSIVITPSTIFYDPEVRSVPEPGSLLLTISGLAFAALGIRRRRT